MSKWLDEALWPTFEPLCWSNSFKDLASAERVGQLSPLWQRTGRSLSIIKADHRICETTPDPIGVFHLGPTFSLLVSFLRRVNNDGF